MYTLIAVHVHFNRFVDLTINRPFAASHSRGTKPPYWRAKVAQERDKQKAYIILNGNSLCCLVPVRRLPFSKTVLYHVIG